MNVIDLANLALNKNLKNNFVRFVNRKSCNKIFENKKKLVILNNEKYNFSEGTKIFISESLTPMNESIAFNCRKLKHSCYNRNGVINIRMTDKRRPIKILYVERLVNLFSDFDFEAGEMYLEVSQDTDVSVSVSDDFKCRSEK